MRERSDSIANRLASESSPYLQQHRDNPVDWYPWGDEAFEIARKEDRPVFLSIGYSACHWCHVMAHESFEDQETAALMNERFVNIKVDREERPDVDAIYMAATQALTGSGGWPMSIFMTPDMKPFYAGTYFPPQPRHGMPSFRQVLESISGAYADRKGEVLDASSRLLSHLAAHNNPSGSVDIPGREVLFDDLDSVVERFDFENGGIGGAPKFPQPLVYEYLLAAWHATGRDDILEVVNKTLTQMARGGLYDQVGGGFHRYSVDPLWLVPHFEKMLYDNALLVPLYLHAYQATDDPLFRRVAVETLEYIRREMTHESGGFYSSQDADSEGEEGKYFVWDAVEFANVLGEEPGSSAAAYWGVSELGNFEGKNILWIPRPAVEVATDLGISEEVLLSRIEAARSLLFERRETRIKPATDDKILTSWNALMCRAFAMAGTILGSSDYIRIARCNAEFMKTELVNGDRVLRTWKHDESGGRARLNGYLEDYAFQIEALIAVYEATLEFSWLSDADHLARQMIDLFWDSEAEAFFDTGRDHEELVVRPRDMFDNATPSGGSSATSALLVLAAYFDKDEYRRIAERSLGTAAELMRQAPLGVPNWLSALDFHTGKVPEIVIIGQFGSGDTESLWAEVHGRYLPHRVVAGAGNGADETRSPMLAERRLVNGQAAAYVCENYVCQLPVTEPAQLGRLIATRVGRPGDAL